MSFPLFWLWITRSSLQWKKKDFLFFALPFTLFFHPSLCSITPSHISALDLLSSWLISSSTPQAFTAYRSSSIRCRKMDLGHSLCFPAGFSRTSTVGHPCCSWGGKLGRTHSQSSWHIVPESRRLSGRSACPDPPGQQINRFLSNNVTHKEPKEHTLGSQRYFCNVFSRFT